MRKRVRKRMIEQSDELHMVAQGRLLVCDTVGIVVPAVSRLMRSEKVRKSRERKSLLRPFKFICCWLQAVRSSGLEGGQEAFIADKDQGVFCTEVTAGNSGVCSVFLGKSPRWRTELWAGAAGGRREES